VLPGKEKTFTDVFSAVLEKMKGMPGHTRSSLYRDVFDPQQFLIISDWSDKGAFDAFISSDQFRSVANWGKEQVLAGRPSHTYYES
jgi:heme-degrading monooxygenase HmoA